MNTRGTDYNLYAKPIFFGVYHDQDFVGPYKDSGEKLFREFDLAKIKQTTKQVMLGCWEF